VFDGGLGGSDDSNDPDGPCGIDGSGGPGGSDGPSGIDDSDGPGGSDGPDGLVEPSCSLQCHIGFFTEFLILLHLCCLWHTALQSSTQHFRGIWPAWIFLLHLCALQ
jgi:hypothetical protein